MIYIYSESKTQSIFYEYTTNIKFKQEYTQLDEKINSITLNHFI